MEIYLLEKLRRCANCGELLSKATETKKTFLRTAKDFVRKILNAYPSARNNDWVFLNKYQEHFGNRFSPTTLLREREILQNPTKGEKEVFPDEETRIKRRDAQANMEHRFGSEA